MVHFWDQILKLGSNIQNRKICFKMANFRNKICTLFCQIYPLKWEWVSLRHSHTPVQTESRGVAIVQSQLCVYMDNYATQVMKIEMSNASNCEQYILKNDHSSSLPSIVLRHEKRYLRSDVHIKCINVAR